MKNFRFLTGDVNYTTYGGKWYRKIDSNDSIVYHVIELINMIEATGEEDQDTYNVSLQEIDLSTCDIASALKCCSYENESNLSELIIVESISSYGSWAPMGSWEGNNYKILLQKARAESHSLDNYDYHEKQLERPVNQLGSTAREYASGDFTSAMIRGIANGDKSACIVGKIHGLNNDDIEKIKNDNNLKDFSLYG